jgi:hypothetical protein
MPQPTTLPRAPRYITFKIAYLLHLYAFQMRSWALQFQTLGIYICSKQNITFHSQGKQVEKLLFVYPGLHCFGMWVRQ